MSGYVYLTRRERFAAAHRLHVPALSDEENLELYDICNNPKGHGHNYEFFVTIKAKPDPVTGMIINLKEMKKIIKDVVVSRFDHKHLDEDCLEFKDKPSTVENVAIVIYDLLKPKLADLDEVKVYETENNYAIYKGSDS